MSIRNKVTGSGFAFALAVGALTVGGSAAHAATAACGTMCSSLYSEMFGTSQVLTVGTTIIFGGEQNCGGFPPIRGCGDVVSLQPASKTKSTQDFMPTDEGTVQQFADAGLISKNLTLHYASDQVFEFQYAPNGINSALCIGLDNVQWAVLEDCGTANSTLWLVDTYDGGGSSSGYTPLINGTSTAFSQPTVLTVHPGDDGGDAPASNMLNLTPLSETAGVIANTQQWADQQGVLP